MNKQKLNKKAITKPECYTVLCTGRVLTLTLKKKWFDMIASGEKKEEYREIKDYWRVRLEEKNAPLDVFTPKKFDKIKFKNGYSKDAPTMIVECLGMELDYSKPEWCNGVIDMFYVIKLGKILFNNALM